MIQLAKITKHYKNAAVVDNITLEVKQGETVALLGTSGCGKTTTLRMINRLVEPTSGAIFINSKDITQQPEETLRRQIGYVLQHHGLFPHYTIAENIAVVPKLLKWEKEKTKKRITELLDKLQLAEDIAGKYPAQLSGGQQQRIGVARALAANPSILLMDEPFGALDPVTRAGIRKQFLELDELKQCTVLLVTHDVQEAFELAERICLMDKGKMVQMGTAMDLLFRPANDFVTSFLKEQQMQLELETLILKDIWTYLPHAKPEHSATFILPDKTLWKTVEVMSLQPDLYFAATHYDEQKPLDIAAIMNAYTHFKTPLKHE